MNNNKTNDMAFDYGIPEGIPGKLLFGMRVLVPFGNGRREGYVVGISENTEAPPDKIKNIIMPTDETPAFSRETYALALWMKEKYYTSLTNCLGLMVPAGTGTKARRIAEISGPGPGFSGKEREIFQYLEESGGKAYVSDIGKAFGKSSGKALRDMESSGAVTLSQEIKSGGRPRLIKFAALSEDGGKLRREKEKMLRDKRCAGQLEIILRLETEGELPLKSFSPASSAAALRKKGLIVLREKEERRDSRVKTCEPPEKKELTPEQRAALDIIEKELGKKAKTPVLLHGITGSGKTEVYMRAIENLFAAGREAIVLVPEISLTPAMTKTLRERFGRRVAITHSRLTAGERYNQWKKAASGEVSVMIGPRSAVFAPFRNLGAIIVDEEHEPAYQSEASPRYDAREVARYRCRQAGALYIAGSATPSLETYYKAVKGEYIIAEMKNRTARGRLPDIEIVDMREELQNGNTSIFSRKLREALWECVRKGEQAMLFINRRGFSTFVSCRRCGYVVKCPSCSVSMTYHAREGRLICHYCGRRIPSPETCPACGSGYIKYFGTGTQKVEEKIREEFPGVGVIRMDADTTGGKGGHERVLSAFAEGRAQILIGTQMIAKGHDFPKVTAVGVIAADLSLNSGDFRDGERTYRMLTQVSGRAGRGSVPGRVFVQTYSPENYSITMAAGDSYAEFFHRELQMRESMDYPPFSNIFNIVLWGGDEKKIIKSIYEIYDIIKYYNKNDKFRILGPGPAYYVKIRDQFRFRIMVKHRDEETLKRFVLFCVEKYCRGGKPKDVHIYLALNPQNMI